jgi:hypothetical protein
MAKGPPGFGRADVMIIPHTSPCSGKIPLPVLTK